MKQLSVYCAHPISGLKWDEVVNYYNTIKTKLTEIGFHVFQPMTGKGEMRTQVSERFKPAGFNAVNPMCTNHAIFERDKWMVQNCDVLYLDLKGCQGISIGCMMELAWASWAGKYTVVVMDEVGIHKHAFVLEAADIVFEDEERALSYLDKLITQEI